MFRSSVKKILRNLTRSCYFLTLLLFQWYYLGVLRKYELFCEMNLLMSSYYHELWGEIIIWDDCGLNVSNRRANWKTGNSNEPEKSCNLWPDRSLKGPFCFVSMWWDIWAVMFWKKNLIMYIDCKRVFFCANSPIQRRLFQWFFFNVWDYYACRLIFSLMPELVEGCDFRNYLQHFLVIASVICLLLLWLR